MSQILLLNMLVAIMTDTFQKTYAKEKSNSMRTKVDFISEFEKKFIRECLAEKVKYLFII